MNTTRVMDFKIRLKDGNGNYYLVRPYLRANLNEIGNVMNYTIVGAAEKGSLNTLQRENLRDMCEQITQYLGRLVRGGRNVFCDVRDFPSERQVRNLLSGRTRKSGMIFPLTGIYLGQKSKTAARRVDEVRKKGVYFHASPVNRSDKPLSREGADALIERNMRAFTGDDPSVLDTEATMNFFEEKDDVRDA